MQADKSMFQLELSPMVQLKTVSSFEIRNWSRLDLNISPGINGINGKSGVNEKSEVWVELQTLGLVLFNSCIFYSQKKISNLMGNLFKHQWYNHVIIYVGGKVHTWKRRVKFFKLIQIWKYFNSMTNIFRQLIVS